MTEVEQTITIMEENLNFMNTNPEFAILMAKELRIPLSEIPLKIANSAYKNRTLFKYVMSAFHVCTNINDAGTAARVTDVYAAYVEPLKLWMIAESADVGGFGEFGLEAHLVRGTRVILICKPDEVEEVALSAKTDLSSPN